jgi:hypothetical protein
MPMQQYQHGNLSKSTMPAKERGQRAAPALMRCSRRL